MRPTTDIPLIQVNARLNQNNFFLNGFILKLPILIWCPKVTSAIWIVDKIKILIWWYS